jgi:hypothetical protein
MNEDSFESVKYFFSLALEDYFGDMDELMEMAGVKHDTLQRFSEMKFSSIA